MTQQELLSTLSKLFIERYAKIFVNLNINVYNTPNEEGTFEVPVPTLGPGGGTQALGKQEGFKLEVPAAVKVQHKRMEAANTVYRISVPRYECEIAANKPEYFNYLFDSTIQKALDNYNNTFGGIDKVRFGSTYCNYVQKENQVFFDLDGGDYLEFRLFGCWASDKEVPKIDISGVANG